MIYRASELINQAINLAQIQDSDAFSWERLNNLLNTAWEHLYYESIQSSSDDFGHQVLFFFSPELNSRYQLPYNTSKIRGVYLKTNEHSRTKLERDNDYIESGNVITFKRTGLMEIEYHPTAPVITFPRAPVENISLVSEWGMASVDGTNVSITTWDGNQFDIVLSATPVKIFMIGLEIIYLDSSGNLRYSHGNSETTITGVTDVWKLNSKSVAYFDGTNYKIIEEDGTIIDAPLQDLYYSKIKDHYYKIDNEAIMEYDDTWRDITADLFPNYESIIINKIISGNHMAAIETDKGIFVWDFNNAERVYNDSIKYLVDYCDNDNGYGLVIKDRIGNTKIIGCYLDTLINWPIGLYAEWIIAELAKQMLIQSRQQDNNIDDLAQDYWERCMFHLHKDIGSPKKLRNRWANTDRRIF
jgi:hypothetical protein